jgi:tetrahydromethanopterin S-methyltransferase subunit A
MPFNANAAKVVEVNKQEITPVVVDPCGVFRVMVDRDAGMLVALHYVTADTKEPSCAIRGVDAEAVMAEVLRLSLVSRLDHAGYLGRELAKAEVALRVGRDYVQDAALFGEMLASHFNT